MATNRAPKQWCLTESETLNTFKNWKKIFAILYLLIQHSSLSLPMMLHGENPLIQLLLVDLQIQLQPMQKMSSLSLCQRKANVLH